MALKRVRDARFYGYMQMQNAPTVVIDAKMMRMTLEYPAKISNTHFLHM